MPKRISPIASVSCRKLVMRLTMFPQSEAAASARSGIWVPRVDLRCRSRRAPESEVERLFCPLTEDSPSSYPTAETKCNEVGLSSSCRDALYLRKELRTVSNRAIDGMPRWFRGSGTPNLGRYCRLIVVSMSSIKQPRERNRRERRTTLFESLSHQLKSMWTLKGRLSFLFQ